MLKRTVYFISTLAISLLIIFPMFISASMGEAVAYLKAQPADPWITQALAAAGSTDIQTSHLTNVSGTLATDYAKIILALSSVGENPAIFGNIDYVIKLKTYFNNDQFGDVSLLNDDVWSILALASVGEVNIAEVEKAENFILKNQNSDGGWGYAASGESDTNDTAAAIIALVEAGVNTSNTAIQNALVYLKTVQNDDGGFGWNLGADSDSGSDAWVIAALNKLNENLSNWEKEGVSPDEHLNTLQDADGGFWWVEPGTSEFNNKAMTAYAVIALSGKSFPVGYYQGDDNPQPGIYHLRIEGAANTICDTYVAGVSAMDLVKNAASNCDFTYVLEETSYGPYLKQINNEAAAGVNGWMYFVNSVSPSVGAADYILEASDQVMFYYGEWGWPPTRLSVNQVIDSGKSALIKVEYYKDESWQPLSAATVKGGSAVYVTDSQGQVSATMANGQYALWAEKSGYVRSNREELTVGQGVSQNVSLVVEIDQGGRPDVGGESLIFEINPNRLNFRRLKPGETNSQVVTLMNSGTVKLNVTAAVNGDNVFSDNLTVNNANWKDFSDSLVSNENKEETVGLAIPEGYVESGIKTGELIFWATPE